MEGQQAGACTRLASNVRILAAIDQLRVSFMMRARLLKIQSINSLPRPCCSSPKESAWPSRSQLRCQISHPSCTWPHTKLSRTRYAVGALTVVVRSVGIDWLRHIVACRCPTSDYPRREGSVKHVRLPTSNDVVRFYRRLLPTWCICDFRITLHSHFTKRKFSSVMFK